MITIADAIVALHPNNSFVLREDDYTKIEWSSTPENPATLEQVNTKLAELQADYDAKSYARARASAFPSITDVVVALAEKEEGNDAMWQEITALRQKVKSENPKPT